MHRTNTFIYATSNIKTKNILVGWYLAILALPFFVYFFILLWIRYINSCIARRYLNTTELFDTAQLIIIDNLFECSSSYSFLNTEIKNYA